MMGKVMLDGDIGERRLRENRKRFWKMVRTGLWMGIGIGVAVGFVAGFAKGWQDAGGRWIGWIVWPAIVGGSFLFLRYCSTYFRKIDEFDLQDNLWSSLIALYFFVMVLPIWQLLHRIDQAPAPDVWLLWWGTLAAAVLGYGWRKLRHRL